MRAVRHHYSRWGIPRGYSATLDQENPAWTPWWLVVTATALLLAGALRSQLYLALIGVGCVVLAVIVSGRRRINARHSCAEDGHDPYHPVDGMRALRCWNCGDELPADYLRHDHEAVHRTASRVKQSYYSDRR